MLYDKNWKAVWATKTNGKGCNAVIKDDGNLVVYDVAGAAKWNSFDSAGSLIS